MIKWLVDRFKERSTWVGLISFASAAGFVVSPELSEMIVTLGLAAVGMVMTVMKDKLPSA